MNTIPLQALPNQSAVVSLGGQNCQLTIYQKRTGLFLDLYVANVLLASGVLCRTGRLMLCSAYLGFVGDFFWLDNQGSTDPVYTGLAGRYTLLYIAPADLPSGSLYS